MPDAYTSTPPSSHPTTPIIKTFTTAEPSPLSQRKATDVPTPVATPPLQDTAAPAPPADIAASRSPVTYRSTSVQTQPPPNGTIFSLIHGRNPTMQDVERKMGLAGMGRYKGPNDVLHGALFGEPFQREPNKSELTTTDSGFQTLDPTLRQKAMTKAKVKAAMIASKYKSVAAKARCKFFGESKDDKVVHTERIASSIQLDADGTVLGDDDLTGRFIPNVYRDDIESEDNVRHPLPAPASHTPASHAQHKTSRTAAHPNDIQSRSVQSQFTATRNTQLSFPIPALQPSSPEGREYTEVAGAAYEYYAFGYDNFGDVVEVPGPYATESDDEFVVIDLKKLTSRSATPKHPQSPELPCKSKESSRIDAFSTTQSDLPPRDGTRKRKDSSQVDAPPTGKDISSHVGTRKRKNILIIDKNEPLQRCKRKNTSQMDDEEFSQRRKRARTASPQPEVNESQDKSHAREERAEGYRKRQERSSSRPVHASKALSTYKREDRKASHKHEYSSRFVHTSRVRSPHGGYEREERVDSSKYEEAPPCSRRDETHVSRRHSKLRAGEDSRQSRRVSAQRDEVDTRKSRFRSRSPIGGDEEANRPSRYRQDAHTARRRSRSPMTGDQEARRPSRDRQNTRTSRPRSRSPVRDKKEAYRPTQIRNGSRTKRSRSRSPVRNIEETDKSARSGRREKQPAPCKEDLDRPTPRAQTPRDLMPATPTLAHSPATPTIPATPTGPSNKDITDQTLAAQIEQNKRDVRAKIAERRAKRGERAPHRAYVPPARR